MCTCMHACVCVSVCTHVRKCVRMSVCEGEDVSGCQWVGLGVYKHVCVCVYVCVCMSYALSPLCMDGNSEFQFHIYVRILLLGTLCV